MKLPGRRKDAPEAPGGALEERQGHGWTHGAGLAVKGTNVLLALSLLAGWVALGTSVFGGPAPAVAASGEATLADRSPEQSAGEFGLRFVSTWLRAVRGQEQAITGYTGGAQSASVRLGETAPAVSEPVVASVAQIDPGRWTVTIAATVGSGTAAVRRYYSVGVAGDQDGQLVALALPAPVSGPTAGAAPGSGYRATVPASSAIWVTCQGFLDALLTGKVDVSRFTSPGSGFVPVTPPPYTAVTVQSIASSRDLTTRDESPATGSQTRVLVSAMASAGAVETSVQYPLTVTARDGRWEVRLLDRIPLLSEQPDTDSAPGEQSSSEASSSP